LYSEILFVDVHWTHKFDFFPIIVRVGIQGGPIDVAVPLAPRDFLNFCRDSLRAARKGLEEALGAPEESGVRMDEWWREASDGVYANMYYQALKDGEWDVWRVRSPLVEGKHMRVMLRLGSPSAVHYQVVDD
jgi:hypothetical protein